MRDSEHYKKLNEIEDNIHSRIEKTHFKPKIIEKYRAKYSN